jgi:hypothetical protein
MNRVLSKIVLGGAVVCMLGFAAGVQARALAVADILISNLVFRNAGTGTILDLSDFAGVVYTNSGDTQACIGAVCDPHSGVGTPLDLYSCVGIGCPANNAYPFLGPPATSTFATGDQNEAGAPITGLGFPTGATVNAGAYASTIDNADTSAQANNGLSSTFVFNLLADTAVQIDFDASHYLDAWTAAGEIFPTNALASTTVCFTITELETGATIVDWCPDGTESALGITAATEPCNLNTNRSRNAPFNGNSTVTCAGSFSATTVTLIGGTVYQLSAREVASADALEVAVPEPNTLLLLGIGLFGVGAIGLRRRNG